MKNNQLLKKVIKDLVGQGLDKSLFRTCRKSTGPDIKLYYDGVYLNKLCPTKTAHQRFDNSFRACIEKVLKDRLGLEVKLR